jgi:hypothetical protein
MTIEGATVIRTGYSRGSGYDEIFLKTVDGRVVVLKAETTTDDDMCIGIKDVLSTCKKRIKGYKEDIKECEKKIKEIEKW